ncbi:hypothetical protein ALC57_05272 [Trachymyrmex cornetzi]|uniref:t-SNARE coiled-coil homology domain-containing protein n=1 Tax=Trachymyrmex cornetzi TaxID=471704 RepID=A0A151JBC0_9HYME|nr:hypothetical protein ALC57_05272 [Trachymyrmex cornetzi]
MHYDIYTVGTYSVGNSFFVYVISIHVFPTIPSPTVYNPIFCCLLTWHQGYSRDNLMKEISSHQNECEKVRIELESLKQNVENMIRECDADYTKANDDDLSNFNGAIFDIRSINNDLTKNIKVEEDGLNKIQNKIKQCTVKLHRI